MSCGIQDLISDPLLRHSDMDAISTTSPVFIQGSIRLLWATGELLVMIRYPYSAGSRDFLLVREEAELRRLLHDRKPRDLVTVMKSFTLLKRGIVTRRFIEDSVRTLKKPAEGDWLVIGCTNDKYLEDWDFAESRRDLKEALEVRIGREVSILDEPDWTNPGAFIDAYSPDPDGIVRPGAY